MELRFLGGAREVGRSAVLVNDSLLLDYGLMTGNPPRLPIDSVDPDAVVVSHGHLDHVGAVPTLCSGPRRPPIHWTPPTYELTQLLARDTLKLHGGSYRCPFTEEELRRVAQVSETHGYGEPFEAAGHEVTFFNAGHIPGSAHVLVDDGETRLLYTGDFYVPGSSSSSSTAQPTRPDEPGRTDHSGNPIYGQRLVPSSTARPEADVIITESTYADIEHEDRAVIEARFVERVQTTLWEGGSVVVPAFAIGRTQELLLVCSAHGIPCYVDGMGKQVTRLLEHHPTFVRDATALRRAVSHARFVTGQDGQRRRIAREGAVIVTTAGMLSGGPAMTYIPAVCDDPTNLIAFTGYQVEGTPGRDLLDTGSVTIDGRRMPVSARVESYDFSAHADARGLRSLLDSYRDANVLVGHGDDATGFAAALRKDGFDANAPEVGDVVVYSPS